MIPLDLNESIVAVFKTLTVAKFTALFDQENAALVRKHTYGGMMEDSYPASNTILDLAHSVYYTVPLANEWTGVTMKAEATAFTAAANTSTHPALGP